MDVEKNGGRLFRRPKLTLSCSAEGKEEFITIIFYGFIKTTVFQKLILFPSSEYERTHASKTAL
jgi:hypothetical protein